MNTLRLIADWRYKEKPANSRDYDSIPAEERDWNSWWYLHGELECLVGYDKATATNCKSAGYTKPTVPWEEIHGSAVTKITDQKPWWAMCVDGIIPVEVEGISEPCVGFFWTAEYRKIRWQDDVYDKWEQRGLVCLKSDRTGCKYAFKKYKERSEIL